MTKTIQMVTTIDDDGVTYEVFDGDLGEGDRGNTSQIFHRLVEFGQDSAHRAGGYAFRAAADAQERCAYVACGLLDPCQGVEDL